MNGRASTPVERLERWELFGAMWRVHSLDLGRALVDLCTCDGELIDQLRSDDPRLIEYLRTRRSSEEPPVA
jgi:hypothetical protein